MVCAHRFTLLPTDRTTRIAQAVLRSTLAVTLTLSLFGCSAGDGEEDPGTDPEGGEATFTLAAAIDSRGNAGVSFDVPNGTTKLTVTAESPKDGVVVRLDELRDEDGNDFLNAGRQPLSLADEPLNFLNNATAPSRDVDPSVNSSARFALNARFEGDIRDGDTVSFTVNSKADGNLNAGVLRVNLFYVGDVGADPNTRAAVGAAIPEFVRIYREQASISVQISEINIGGPVSVVAPITGDRFYLSASRGAFSPAVNVFILGDISDFAGSVLGVSGGIPGPPNPSPRSGVAISIITSAGADGRFSDQDIRVLAETIAHEVGHYLGLFHPVDFSGEVVTDRDPLDDTLDCSNFFECANTSLVNNLMFSTPVENNAGALVEQNQLTRQQSGVMNRYAVVD